MSCGAFTLIILYIVLLPLLLLFVRMRALHARGDHLNFRSLIGAHRAHDALPRGPFHQGLCSGMKIFASPVTLQKFLAAVCYPALLHLQSAIAPVLQRLGSLKPKGGQRGSCRPTPQLWQCANQRTQLGVVG